VGSGKANHSSFSYWALGIDQHLPIFLLKGAMYIDFAVILPKVAQNQY
jgi:hypothetical protein